MAGRSSVLWMMAAMVRQPLDKAAELFVRRYTRVMPHNDARLIPVSLDPSPVIDAYKGGVDRTLLRENLKLTTSQRVEKMTAALRFADAVRHSRTKAVAT